MRARRTRRAAAVPGDEVAIHWLDLAEGLAPAQAAAAARLMLADASAAPLADMHVAVGRRENGLTPVALVPNARMAAWLAAWVAGDPDIVAALALPAAPAGRGLRAARQRGRAGLSRRWRRPSASSRTLPRC